MSGGETGRYGRGGATHAEKVCSAQLSRGSGRGRRGDVINVSSSQRAAQTYRSMAGSNNRSHIRGDSSIESKDMAPDQPHAEGENTSTQLSTILSPCHTVVPCLEYIDHSSYTDDPVRIQYCMRLQHYNVILSSERMAQLPRMSNVCLQSGGLSIIFSDAFSRAVVNDAGQQQCPAAGPGPAVPVLAHKTSSAIQAAVPVFAHKASAAIQAGIAPELHSSDSFSDSALPGEHINQSLSLTRWRVSLCACAHINTTYYICVRVRTLTLHIHQRILTLHIILNCTRTPCYVRTWVCIVR